MLQKDFALGAVGILIKLKMTEKQARYTTNGKDLIDDWAERKSMIEFRAIMLAQIEKYARRYGKKDLPVKEAEKILDYAQRLYEYEVEHEENIQKMIGEL